MSGAQAGWLLILLAIALLAYPVAVWLSFRWLGHPKGSRLLPEHRRSFRVMDCGWGHRVG